MIRNIIVLLYQNYKKYDYMIKLVSIILREKLVSILKPIKTDKFVTRLFFLNEIYSFKIIRAGNFNSQ